MSELHKWCDADDLPRRPLAPYNPGLSIRVRGWFLARWDALKFALEAPERRRLRHAMDLELIDRSEHYSYGPAEHSARLRLGLPPRVIT